MDDTRIITSLQSLGKAKAREEFPQLQKVFFGKPAVRFNPIYTLAAS